MSKPLAAFYGQKSVNQPPQPKPQEYTVLGVNQPLVVPEQDRLPESWPMALPTASGQRKFRLMLLLNKFL